MKRVKRIASFLLAMVMVLGMGLTALAEQTGSLTINGTQEGQKYDLYQVFELVYTAGTGGNATSAQYSYKVTDAFAGFFNTGAYAGKDAVEYVGSLTSADKAEELSKLAQALLAYATEKVGNPASPRITPTRTVTPTKNDAGNITAVAENLPYGYYLLNPLGGSTPSEIPNSDPSANYATMFALNTLSGGDTTINVKANYPTVDKSVSNNSVPELGQDLNEISIGKEMHFHLEAKVPDTTGYNRYWFIFEDTLSEGLTYTTGSAVVKIGNNTLTAITAENENGNYTIEEPDEDSNCIKIVFKDFLDYVTTNKISVGTAITVDYKAKLNEKAAIGTANENKVVLKYSNDPKHEYNGDKPEPNSKDPVGETVESVTKTYTTSLTIHKKDGDGNALTGAKFKISGDSVYTVVTTGEVFVESSDGTYYKLKDGTYTTTAPVTGTEDKYESTTTKYEKKTNVALDTKASENPVSAEAFVDKDGNLTFAGLGEGIYRISEVVTPEGYNTIEDFPVEIKFDEKTEKFTATRGYYKTDEDGNEKAYFGTEDDKNNIIVLTKEENDNKFDTNVINKKGVLLPSTGGMGTTIFYVLGGILVLGAGVLLVTRRKMSAEK